MTDSKQEHADAFKALRDKELGEAVARGIDITAASVARHYRMLVSLGLDEGLAEELTINFQNTFVAMSFMHADRGGTPPIMNQEDGAT